MIFALLFICFYLPFQLALNPAADVDLASIRVLVLIIFFAWLARGLKNKKINIQNNFLTGSVVFFIFINCLAFFYAENPVWSGRKLMFLLSLFPLFFVVSDLSAGRAGIERIFKALVFSGAAASGIGLLQFFSQFIFGIEGVFEFWAKYVVPPFLGANLTEAVLRYPSWLVNISGSTYLRTTSVFPDPHMFSMYLGLLIPAAAGLALYSRKKIWFWAAGLMLLADILTFSRGGYLGILGGMLFSFIILIPRFGRKARIFFLIAALAIAAAIIIPNPISARFAAIFDFSEGSNTGRIEIWRKAAELIAKNPFSGVGIGNFSYAVNPLAGYREPIYAHNTYLDISVEAGILAGLAWIGMLGASLERLLKRKSVLFFGLAAGIVVFSLHSLVETGLYSPTVLTLVLIYLGLGNAKIDEKSI